MHKKYKILIATILICSFTFVSYGEELDELRNQKSEIQSQIDESNNELSNIDEELTQNLQQIQKLDENIQVSEKSLNELNEQISRNGRRSSKSRRFSRKNNK